MNLFVQWDIKDLLQAADRMALQNYLPEFIAKTVAVSMRDLAENKARDKLGNGRFAVRQSVKWIRHSVNQLIDRWLRFNGE